MKAMSAIFAFTLGTLLLTSCKSASDMNAWDAILIIIVFVIAMVILNRILEFLAVKFAYIYWPLCLAASIFLFFLCKNTGGLESAVNNGIVFPHIILLYLLIPNMNDSVKHYTEITYEYDYTWNEYRESDRKSVTEETPGFLIKLGVIIVLILVLFYVPKWVTGSYPSWWIYLSFGLEGLWSLYFSSLGIYRVIKYHG